MQHAVDYEMSVVCGEALALRVRLARDQRRAQREIAVQRRRLPHDEREHVGRAVLAAESPVERLRFDFADDAQRDARVTLERRARPPAQLCAGRNAACLNSVLHGQIQFWAQGFGSGACSACSFFNLERGTRNL